MKYKNASHVLPDELLKEVQKYAAGEAIYIPKLENRKSWGSRSGARDFFEERNKCIRNDYENGATMTELCERYALAYVSIRKIVYSKNSTVGRCHNNDE